jgi:Spy/CpxP family protein refolding chaperone
MKSKLITAVAAATIIIGVSAMNASAWNHRGPMVGSGHGVMHVSGTTDAENQEFLNETKEARIKIATDQIELNALMAGQNPDGKRVRELAEKIATNQLVLEEKARASGYADGRMHGNHTQDTAMMNGGHYRGCGW